MTKLNKFGLSLTMINRIVGETHSFTADNIYAFAEKTSISQVEGKPNTNIFTLNPYFGYQMSQNLIISETEDVSSIDVLSVDYPISNDSILICDSIDLSLMRPINYVAVNTNVNNNTSSTSSNATVVIGSDVGKITVSNPDDLVIVTQLQEVNISNAETCDPIILLLPLSTSGSESVSNITAMEAANEFSQYLTSIVDDPDVYDGEIQIVEDAALEFPSCVWWDDTIGNWSGNGCILYGYTNFYAICLCTHLTSFSLRLNDYEPKLNVVTEDSFMYVCLHMSSVYA